MKTWFCLLLWLIACTSPLLADDLFVTSADKFRSAEETAGAGFFWVDSSTGRTWKLDAAKPQWVYCGQPSGAMPGAVGTYLPHPNKSGPGIFILNTATGEGWLYNGTAWQSLGIPVETPAR